MKQFKAILFAVVIFSFLSFQEINSLEGKWELFKMETPEGEVNETNGRWMHFMKDGVLKGGNTLDTTNRTGNWSYDSKTKSLTFGSEKQLSGEGTYTVNWIDAKTISLTLERGRKVYLKRIKEE
ncbi:hypothetical protein [Kordia zhangzhouensis]|uniref:hypothetical protein n=1 Tax=Kordia zhangzhouensis TaxID=1620405 RepID=UPI0012F76D30|nr:hypothetical protein [Kordia zhangzhouensis]